MTVVMTNLVVVTHRGVGGNSRAGEHGKSYNSKQYVPEHFHDFAPSGESGAAFALRRGRWMQNDTNALWGTQNFR